MTGSLDRLESLIQRVHADPARRRRRIRRYHDDELMERLRIRTRKLVKLLLVARMSPDQSVPMVRDLDITERRALDAVRRILKHRPRWVADLTPGERMAVGLEG